MLFVDNIVLHADYVFCLAVFFFYIGGTHQDTMRTGDAEEDLTDDQKDLLSWMDERYFKVQFRHTYTKCRMHI